MSGRQCEVLILDWDQDALIRLQYALENAGVDTTITWDDLEARELLKNEPFDVRLIGDHPPELTTETVFRDFNLNLLACPCLLLRASPSGCEHSRPLAISAIIPKREPFRVLEQVQKHFHFKQSELGTMTTGLAENPELSTGASRSVKQAA